MMYRFLIVAICVTLCSQVWACIFQSHNVSKRPAFWPSKEIEVCFLPPRSAQNLSAANPLDKEYRQIYERNVRVIKRTYQEQINQRTKFKTVGFETCKSEDANKPMIRIDLNAAGGGQGAMASSIGPRSSAIESNLVLTTVNADWPNGQKPTNRNGPLPERVRVFNPQEHISWAALHEALHLLGLHHTEYWDQDMDRADEDLDRVIQWGGSPDEQSIMSRGVRNYNSQGIAQLSQRDVQCLDHIANKTIMDFPSRIVTASEQAPTQSPSINEKSEPTLFPSSIRGRKSTQPCVGLD